jgi:hypothetical protein
MVMNPENDPDNPNRFGAILIPTPTLVCSLIRKSLSDFSGFLDLLASSLSLNQ